jgi:hypothetical protein
MSGKPGVSPPAGPVAPPPRPGGPERATWPSSAPDGGWNPFEDREGPSPCMPPPDVWKRIADRRAEVTAFLKKADRSDPAVAAFLAYYPFLA